MSDDDEFRRVAEIERAANGKASYLDMDAGFCARMRIATRRELETPTTYPTEVWLLASSSLSDMDL
jgi:hypothetical protein